MVNWKKLKNKIPAKVQIGRKITYDVLWFNHDEKNTHFGVTDYNKQQLQMELGNSPKETVKTYVHELLHAFSKEHNVNLTETQILALEETFYYWLKPDNIFKK